ncbi:MAG TPA: adenosylcobinamide-phosphate synthase CbiB [Thermohalobaculum sp.]|nr:adenosylcobinamide-phosphate synthase CbiB [Thermohalobaculum sp.]
MLALALVIDAILGEPDWLWKRWPHPAVLMGGFIGWLEQRLNRGAHRLEKGVLAIVALVIVVWLPAFVLSHGVFHGVFEVLGAAVLIAQRSLMDHVRAVGEALRVSLTMGRDAVAKIVGREPDALDKAGVARAAIESAAENFSDGVAAPVFWFLVGGLPGIAIYKAVNTADSMIGHRTERYREFGWAAAKLDDVLNWFPARLAGLLICLVGGGRRAIMVMLTEAPMHKSPSAGWPEAAVAASLDIALAGPRVYDGVLVDDSYMNEEGRRTATHLDIEAAVRLIWRAWWGVLVVALLAALLGR